MVTIWSLAIGKVANREQSLVVSSGSKHEEKHFRENALPTGKIEPEVTQGRADVGDVPTAKTLGRLARKVISKSRHAESRELARGCLAVTGRFHEASLMEDCRVNVLH
jgi:hypothetical protein